MDEISTVDVSTYGGVGSLLPLLLAIINRPTFPTWLRGTIMIVVSVLAGVITYGLKNAWDFTSVPSVLAAVIGVAAATQVAYHALWKPNGIAPAVERTVNSGDTSAATPDDADATTADHDVDEDVPANDHETAGRYASEENDHEMIEGDDPDAYADADLGDDDDRRH